jgi:hypothetical protein
VENCPTGYFIKVRRSVDHGATFGPPAVAASAQGCGEHLGFADVKIGDKGVAYILYSRDDRRGGDVSNIEYAWSPPPYVAWSAPVIINDDGGTGVQNGPSLAVQTCGKTTVLHTVWSDERLTPPGSPDHRQNVFYSTKAAKDGTVWSKNLRVSNKPVIDQFSSGISPDVVVAKGNAFAAWTNNGNVFGKGIPKTLQCR